MMRAITVRSPWVDCITLGAKTVENRGRFTSWRGEFAIHAGLTVADAAFSDPRVAQTLGPAPSTTPHLGKVVAVANLVDCHEAEQYEDGCTCCARSWGDRTYNGNPAWHLVFADVRVLRWPVRCRGALQVGWRLPEDAERQVRQQLMLSVAP